MDDQSEAVVGADVAGEEPITLVAEDIPPNPSPEFLRQRRERLEIERKAMEASDGDAVPASPEQIEALNNTLLVNEGRPATIGDIEAVKAVLRDEMLKKATSEVTRDDDRNFTSAKIVRFRGGPADEMTQELQAMPADRLVCFFGHSEGSPQQAVYRLALREIERTEEEKKANTPATYEWVAEYVGQRRYLPPLQVNGVRKGV